MSNSERSAKGRTFPGLDAGLGPARPLSRPGVEWLVEQVVERAFGPGKKPRPRLLSLRSLSLAALAIVTSAAAATIVNQVHKNAGASAPHVSGLRQQPKKHSPARSRPLPASERTPEAAPVADIPAAAPDSRAPLEKSAGVPPLARESTAPAANSLNSISAANEAPAADQLSAANEFRRQGRWQAAEAAYRDVAARCPQTQEAYVAQLAAAELRLEHLGDPAGALRLYESVPRNNALGVEALFGVSRVYRALGDPKSESVALRSLLDAYPASLQADRARKRLKQLAAESTAP
jgi:hypothetical protein